MTLPGRTITEYTEGTLSVAGIEYSFASTDGISLDIFLAGCTRDPHCPGCHSPGLWDRKNGKEMTPSDLVAEALKHPQRKIMICGGEPEAVRQDVMCELLTQLKNNGYEIWYYTGQEFQDIRSKVLELCDWVKSGPYREDLPWLAEEQTRELPLLASRGQRFHKKINGAWVVMKGC